MRCTGSKKILVTACVAVLIVLVSTGTAAAVCLSNGNACGAPIQANDRLCCPGSICGPWGNVCQPGCRIGGVAYRAGQVNPNNACQVCTPASSTTAWSNVANGTTCSDNNRCTTNDRCQAGSCVPGAPVTCLPLDQCHVAGVCNPATGVCTNPNATDGTACTDGSLCTQTDACQGGSCIGTNPVVCPAPDQCHNPGTCIPASGTCTNPAKPDGVACNDANPCTQTDTCVGGLCSGGNPVNCAVDPCHDPCHLSGTCDTTSGLCVRPNAPNGTPCDDGNICNLDACVDGTCTPQVPNPTFDHCANGIKDCDESDVDCGGSCPTVCPNTCSAPCDDRVCGSDGNGDCSCDPSTEGDCFCKTEGFCEGQACGNSSDCPAGERCVLVPCTAQPLCRAGCGVSAFRSVGGTLRDGIPRGN